MARARVLLLTGVPGVGKTTLVQRVVAALGDHRIAGFTTEEIRGPMGREGFRLVTFDGDAAVMSHVDLPKTHRVAKYGVDVGAIDSLVASAMRPREEIDLYVIDEIGKMECFSSRFVAAMRTLLAGDTPVLATIARRGGGFIAEVKETPTATLWEITRANRDEMPDRVVSWVRGEDP